jgi:CheY-like chemotaxis protein
MAKVLIVDDDIQTTALFEKLITNNGHDCVAVNNSWTAIETIKQENPSLILLDIMMPRVNGLELCKMIKTNPSMKHIHVIIVSAMSDMGTRRDSFHAGADDFLSKPIFVHDFASKLRSVLTPGDKSSEG